MEEPKKIDPVVKLPDDWLTRGIEPDYKKIKEDARRRAGELEDVMIDALSSPENPQGQGWRK